MEDVLHRYIMPLCVENFCIEACDSSLMGLSSEVVASLNIIQRKIHNSYLYLLRIILYYDLWWDLWYGFGCFSVSRSPKDECDPVKYSQVTVLGTLKWNAPKASMLCIPDQFWHVLHSVKENCCSRTEFIDLGWGLGSEFTFGFSFGSNADRLFAWRLEPKLVIGDFVWSANLSFRSVSPLSWWGSVSVTSFCGWSRRALNSSTSSSSVSLLCFSSTSLSPERRLSAVSPSTPEIAKVVISFAPLS